MDINEPESQKKKKPVAVNWREVERRMQAARSAIERVWAPSPEETQRILKARARVLAQEPVPAEAAGERIEVVEFLLASEHYAIESHYVREVYSLENLTPLPCTPAFVLGIVNVRGEILSVIDIRRFFDLPQQGLTDLNKVIIVRSQEMEIGILADAILGARSIARADIQSSLPTLTGIREDYLTGVTRERVVVLDAAKLLSDKKIVVQEEVQA